MLIALLADKATLAMVRGAKKNLDFDCEKGERVRHSNTGRSYDSSLERPVSLVLWFINTRAHILGEAAELLNTG